MQLSPHGWALEFCGFRLRVLLCCRLPANCYKASSLPTRPERTERNMRFILTGLLALIVLSSTMVSRADTLQTFSLTATLQSGSAFGTVILDKTTGTFLQAQITANGLTFSGVPNLVDQEPDYVRVHFGLDGSTDPGETAFGLDLPVSTLIGYDGGDLCTEFDSCGTVRSAIGYQTDVPLNQVVAGTLTAITPEPSSFMLLGTAAVWSLATIRRRSA